MQSSDLLKQFFLISFNYHLSTVSLLNTGSPSQMSEAEFQNKLKDMNLLAQKYANMTETVMKHLRTIDKLSNEDLEYLKEFYNELQESRSRSKE